MQDKINKIIYIILLVLIIGFISIAIYNKYFGIKEYTIKFESLNTKVAITLYKVDKNVANEALNEVNEVFKTFDDLTNKEKEIGNNLYYIKNNTSDLEYIDIDPKLYDLIEYGLSWYEKSDGLIDISSGDIKEAFNNGTLDKEKLKSLKRDIDDIVLKDNKIKNNHISIDLDDVLIGYVTDYVADILKHKNIDCYYIYVGGLVKVGKHYEDEFSIGLEDPSSKNNDIYQVVYGNDLSVSTINYNKDMINLKTYEEVDNVYGLSIIGNDTRDTYVMSKLAFMYELSDSIDYINNSDKEGIWFKFSKNTVTSDNLDKYLKKEK